jgi:hypothetical protein
MISGLDPGRNSGLGSDRNGRLFPGKISGCTQVGIVVWTQVGIEGWTQVGIEGRTQVGIVAVFRYDWRAGSR